VLAVLFLPLFSMAQQQSDKPAVHGMLLIGEKTVYASHLSMFHRPHDYQIILMLHMETKVHKHYNADRLAHPDETVYTLEPEVFVLPEKVKHGNSFKANIYRGHFERGGVKIIENATVIIAKVVYFKHFEIHEDRPEYLNYILFGNSEEQFLAHYISKRPDFDEIIRIHTGKKGKKLLGSASYIRLVFPEKEIGKPYFRTTPEIEVTYGTTKLKIKKIATLYIEYEDLK
ncbi:MAG: hypothetical protein AAF934_08560, partial [Bacteroidota bacterium]